MESCWSVLGLPGPTPDAGAVRRAYAARLKDLRPDTDPQGFMRVRAAYETALERARRWSADESAAPEEDAEPDADERESGRLSVVDAPDPPAEPSASHPDPVFDAGPAAQRLRLLERRLVRARQRAVETAVGWWLDAFSEGAADPGATALPPFPPGADLAFVEGLEQRLAAFLDDAPEDAVPPALWLALERRFGWHDDLHPVWQEHPWLLETRDAARERREVDALWTGFLASKGIVLEDGGEGGTDPHPADKAPAARALAVFRAGSKEFQTAWGYLDAPPGRSGKPPLRWRLRAYVGGLAEAIATLLDEGRRLAPGFWEARAAPATLAYWDARSRRHRGLGFTGAALWALFFFLPALLVLMVFLAMGEAPSGVAVPVALVGGVAIAGLGLEAVARLRWFLVRQNRRLTAALEPWRERLRARPWPYALASLGVAALALLLAPLPLLPGVWPVLVAAAFGLAWVGIGVPPLSVVWLLAIGGTPLDLTLLDWVARDAPGRPAWAWAPLTIIANRLLLWLAMTRLPSLVLRRFAPRLPARGGWLVLLVGALWLFVLPPVLRQALDLPAESDKTAARPVLPVPRPVGPRPSAPLREREPVLPPLQET